MLKAQHLWTVLSFAGLVISAFVAPSASALEGGEGEAKLFIYEAGEGETYFALSLTPTINPSSTRDSEVVVLFDTSASQAGNYRSDALSALQTMLDRLDESARVKLIAVDLEATMLTDGFVAPQGEAINTALEQLAERTPLGSTDMVAALDAASSSFGTADASLRSVIYIGDGQSKANLLGTDELNSTIAGLVEKRASLSSYVIGPERGAILMAALSNQTGGMMLVDTSETLGTAAGQMLAEFTEGVVFWVIDAQFGEAIDEVYPKAVPPLRIGRETIIIGTLQGEMRQDVAMTVEVAGQQLDMRWKVLAGRSDDENAYLADVVDAARFDEGATLPALGLAGLHELRRILFASAESLSRLSAQALASGDEEGARRLAEAALLRDPGNTVAKAVIEALNDESVSD